MNILGYAQKLGKALMLPIATLPVAALLLRLGQPDLLGIPFMAAAGDAIFSQLHYCLVWVLPLVYRKMDLAPQV